MNIVFYICVIIIALAAILVFYPVVSKVARSVFELFKRYYDNFRDDDHNIYM